MDQTIQDAICEIKSSLESLDSVWSPKPFEGSPYSVVFTCNYANSVNEIENRLLATGLEFVYEPANKTVSQFTAVVWVAV